MKFTNLKSVKSARLRKSSGSSILELPAALWIGLIVFFVPMMALASITLRSSLLNIAVQDAVHAAAKARTFTQASDEGPSAKEVASQVFTDHIAAFPGLGVAAVNLSILSTPFNGAATIRTDNKLSQAADTSSFVYQVETSATGIIEPVFGANAELFGSIPGLTAPMKVSVSAREMFENPQGLDR